ncbi:MAG: hypothetical protein HRU09_21195 [Oligoflexales bacterium]|nr:hypothetical protein [Oligoflexales bacterium]
MHFENPISPKLLIKPLVWKHHLQLMLPENIRSQHVFIYLSSGDHANPGMHPCLERFGRETGTIVAQLRVLSNGPLIDCNNGKDLSEDHGMALSWKEFLLDQDDGLLIQLQLQEMVVKAISLIESFLVKDRGVKFSGCVLSGQSKRAHLAWLTASKDERVIGIIPIVFDLLNLRSNLLHHHQVYGRWADALAPYAEYGIPDKINSISFDKLAKKIDPFCFKEKIEKPKYVINAANDEYFLPDSSQFYFSKLQGIKGLRYIPNHGHRLEDHGQAYWDDVFSAFKLMSRGISFPEVRWEYTDDELVSRCSEI